MTDTNINQLPPELLTKIFHFLNFYDIQSAQLTCKYWYTITKLPEFDLKGVYKIQYCLLDNSHFAADLIFNRQIERLCLENVQFGEVEKLFQHMGATLQELSLKCFPTAVSLKLVFKHLVQLRKLKICYMVSPDVFDNVDHIEGCLPELRDLELKENDSYVNAYILKRARNSPALERIKVENIGDDDELLKLIETNNSIKCISVGYYGQRPLDSMRWIQALSALSLTELSLKGNFRDNLLTNVIKNQTTLRTLEVIGCGEICDYHLAIMGEHLTQLEKLSLEFCSRVTTSGLLHFSKLSRLKSLDVSYCHTISSLPDLKESNFEELILQNTNIDENIVCACAKSLVNLKVLNLNECRNAVTNKSIQKIFEYQRNLRQLSLKNCTRIDDGGMLGLETGNSIKCLKRLQNLDLQGCAQLSDVILDAVSKLPDLRLLDISYCKAMTDSGLEAVARNCKVIEKMSISVSWGITKRAAEILIISLRRLKKLKVFNDRTVDIKAPPNWLRVGPSSENIAFVFKRQPNLS